MFSNLAKKHLSDIRPYIIFSVSVFLFSVFIGFLFASSSPDQANQVIEQIKETAGGIGDIGSLQFFIYIFLRNALVSFLAIIFGAILGILPLLSLFTNGAILGVLAYFFSSNISLSLFFLAGIVPHGIFELPAFFFSTASGIWLGVAALRRLTLGEREFGAKFRQTMKFFFSVVVPILVLAAFVETFITPRILSFIGSSL